MNQESPKKLTAKELHSWLCTSSISPVLIDVREEQELAMAAFPSEIIHLPLSKSSGWVGTLRQRIPTNQPVVVICHAGVRSWNFGRWLLEQGFGYEVWNLDGGIDAWSVDVDPSVPRY